MEFDWLYVIGTLVTFFVFWGAVAYRVYKADNKPFFETWTRMMGFYFWYKHVGAQIALSIVPSLAFTFLALQNIATQTFASASISYKLITYVVTLYLAIPIINGILFIFFRKNEKARRVITYVSSFWFTIILLYAILFGFIAYFMNR